jgi:hypothetical protein
MIFVIVTAAIALIAVPKSSSRADATVTTTTSSSTEAGATFLVRVVEESNMSPIAGMSVVAGPASSPNDVADTPGGTTLSECVHEVPSGSIVNRNGTVVSYGSTLTFPPCPLKEYVTNSTGWVSITNATGVWYFIKAGNVNVWNDVVLGVLPNNVVNMAIPLPSGNATVPSSLKSCVTSTFSNITSTCTRVPGTPVLWPLTTIVWPCGEGLPNGSAVTPQGFYGGYYIAYSFAAFPNGTKAALTNDCNIGSL